MNSGGKFLVLEKWMSFSINLSRFVKQFPSPIKLYISVPSSLMFLYFFILGSVDYDFKNPPKNVLFRKYLSLQRGQRILYKTGEDWVAHSVIEVGTIPNEKTRAILVKDRSNCINHIPETRWVNYIRIYDDEITEVRNLRRVRNVDHLTDNLKLRKLYSEENLNLLMMLNTPQTYIYCNREKWNENLSHISLEIGGEEIRLEEFLFDGTEGTYKNISFIKQNESSKVPNESTVIFVGSSRSLRKVDHYDKQKCVFIVDQHESEEKMDDLQFKIEQDFLINNSQSINMYLQEYLDKNSIEIPRGVEVFAWSSKS